MAQAMARPKQEKSEARWRDYAADRYFHYYYRYGEDEEGAPLADDHRHDDLLELAAEPVKSLTSFKHYEGGKTARGVGDETGFVFTRRRLGCYCVPAAGASCCHAGWTGEAMHGDVTPAALRAACGLIGWVPLGTGVLQLLAWRHFDLRGAKLRAVQAAAAVPPGTADEPADLLEHATEDIRYG